MSAASLSPVVAAYYGIPLVSGLLTFSLAYWVYRNHRGQRGVDWFLLTLCIGGLGTLLFFVRLVGPSLAFKRTMSPVAGFVGFLAYASFTVFCGKYTDSDYHRHPVVAGALVTYLGGFVLLYVTRPYHDLWVSNVRLVSGPIVYYAYDPEPGLGLLILLVFAVAMYNVYRLFVYLLSTSTRTNTQLAVLICAPASVMVVTAASFAGWFPAEHLDHSAYATFPFIVFVTVALFRYDLLSVQPVARNAVVEDLTDPVLVLDGGNRVVDFNAASTRVWPELTDSLGDPLASAAPEVADAVRSADGESSTRITLSVDGQSRHFSIQLSSVAGGHTGQADWHSVLLRDVTDIERSRWQLERQNERLDQVAATISHDLRNPINVASGYVELLGKLIDEDGLDGVDAKQAQEYVDDIGATHDRMVDIIEDVLTIAREGQTVEETEPVAVGEAARQAWGNVETTGATLEVVDDRTVRADRSKLLSVFENLVRNAVEHGGADVTVEVGATADGFYVTDDGPGIPDRFQDDVFEAGFTTVAEGTGLGLSIVETIAESHGWTVEYDGAPEVGARFVFGNVEWSPVTTRTPADAGR